MEYSVISPFTGEVIGTAPDLTPADVEANVALASAAAPAWRRRAWRDRAALLAAAAHALRSDVGAMTELLAMETGITLAQAGFVVMKAAEEFEYWSNVPEDALITTHEAETFGPSSVSLEELRRPHGVVAAILPYNASIMGAAAKMAPALLVGNAVVTKAPPQNPLAMLRLFGLLREAGLDADVASLVTGRSAELGQALVSDPRVDMISFTGSTAVGVAIQREAAKRLARTALELGGKGPLIVAADADVSEAVAALVGVWTRQAGQICSIPSRAIVHTHVYPLVRDALRRAIGDLEYARHWSDPTGSTVGPVISREHAQRVEDLIARSHGPNVQITRGTPAPSAFHVSPALVETTDTTIPAFREEAFGPVLTLVEATNDDEAVRLANDSEYGLVGYIYSTDREHAQQLATDLQVGAVVVNGVVRHSLASSGGVKSSGIAREGRIASLEIYTEPISVSWHTR